MALLKIQFNGASRVALSERSESKGRQGVDTISTYRQMYSVYILRLQNGHLYVGSTNDLPRRLAEHRSGHGGKTTADSPPIELVYSEVLPDRPTALQRERQLKRWSHAKKLALASGNLTELRKLAKRQTTRSHLIKDDQANHGKSRDLPRANESNRWACRERTQ